jgi:hypothetical protein
VTTSYTAEADRLTDTEDLGEQLADIAGRTLATGLDPDITKPILVATILLDKRPNRGPAWANDTEMVSAIDEFNLALWARIVEVQHLTATVEQARTRALHELEQARRALQAARNERERNVARSRISEARRTIADCVEALEILKELDLCLHGVAARLLNPEDELTDTYEAAYQTVSRGHRLPHDGRFLGATA